MPHRSLALDSDRSIFSGQHRFENQSAAVEPPFVAEAASGGLRRSPKRSPRKETPPTLSASEHAKPSSLGASIRPEVANWLILVEELAAESGVALTHLQAGLRVGACPLHPGAEPDSLLLNTPENTWTCRGACNTTGTALDWVMRRDGIDLEHAAEVIFWTSSRLAKAYLANRAAAGPAEGAPRPAPDAEMEICATSSLAASSAPMGGATMDAEDQKLLNEAAAHYHRTLVASPGVLQGLRWRGCVAEAAIEHFDLGYADRTLVATLAPKGATRLARLKALGLVCHSGRELFGGALVVPIRNAAGDVVQMCGVYHGSTGRHTPDLYLPGPRRGLFHPAAFELSEELVLTSSPLDAIRFWYAGHVNATCADGVLLRDEHILAMKKHQKKRVLIAYDIKPDAEQAAHEVAERLAQEGIAAYRVQLPRRFKPTSRRWGDVLRAAAPMLGAPPRPEQGPLPPNWQRPTAWSASSKERR